MFLKYSNSLFFSILLVTPMLVISSSTWAVIWMSLEINLMMFIPLLMNKINFNSTSSSIKYFIVQAMASSILIFSFILFSNKNNIYSINMNNEMICFSMMMKSGVPPFQFWLPQIMESMDFFNLMMLVTWQKISPLFLLTLFISNTMFIILIISSLVGSIGGINQNSVKKILAYSSMSHASWIIITLFLNMKMWFVYFLVYSFMIFSLVLIFNQYKINMISQIIELKASLFTKVTMAINLMSLGGLPPFIGFMTKFIILNYMVYSFLIKMIILIMIMMSLLSLFYYFKLCYLILFNSAMSFKFKFQHNTKINLIFSFLTIFSNVLIPVTFIFF